MTRGKNPQTLDPRTKYKKQLPLVSFLCCAGARYNDLPSASLAGDVNGPLRFGVVGARGDG